VGKLRTVLLLSGVIRDSAVQLVLTHQRAARAGCEGPRTSLGVPRSLKISSSWCSSPVPGSSVAISAISAKMQPTPHMSMEVL
jgi:hypothetical protein